MSDGLMEKQISSRYFKRLINQSLFALILAKEKKNYNFDENIKSKKFEY